MHTDDTTSIRLMGIEMEGKRKRVRKERETDKSDKRTVRHRERETGRNRQQRDIFSVTEYIVTLN